MVVLPAWVPPATSTLRPARIEASRKPRGAWRHAAQLDEVVETGRAEHKFADVHRS